MTALDICKARAKAELAARNQIEWKLAFVTSSPSLSSLKEWFPEVPNMRKAEAIEYLAGRCLTVSECVDVLKTGAYPQSVVETLVDAYQTGGLVSMYITDEYNEIVELLAYSCRKLARKHGQY